MTDNLEELERLLAKATPGPWSLCQHLKSVEDDAACRCGYRGVVFGPEHEVAMAVFQPGHERPSRQEEWGTEPGRYPREIEIANSQLIVALRNAAPSLIATAREVEGLRSEVARLREVVMSVVDATRAYLPPDGINEQGCINRIIAATDNPEINPIIAEIENGCS